MGSTVLFGTIYRSHYIILANFYFYLQYFQQKNFNFIKISEFQTDLNGCGQYLWLSDHMYPILVFVVVVGSVFRFDLRIDCGLKRGKKRDREE